jgi:hypothetical protein
MQNEAGEATSGLTQVALVCGKMRTRSTQVSQYFENALKQVVVWQVRQHPAAAMTHRR